MLTHLDSQPPDEFLRQLVLLALYELMQVPSWIQQQDQELVAAAAGCKYCSRCCNVQDCAGRMGSGPCRWVTSQPCLAGKL